MSIQVDFLVGEFTKKTSHGASQIASNRPESFIESIVLVAQSLNHFAGQCTKVIYGKILFDASGDAFEFRRKLVRPTVDLALRNGAVCIGEHAFTTA